MNNEYDLIILGTGPAGLSAALYAARAELKVKIIEKGTPGGRLVNTHSVENYLGVGNITGIKFAQDNLSQIMAMGVTIDFATVEKVEKENDDIFLYVKGEKKYKAKTLFISTGTRTKKLDVPGYDEFYNKGISHCLVCDGALFKGKHVAVIGGGNSATEESLFASDVLGQITIINKFDKFNAEQITLDKLNQKENVNFIFNTDVIKINGEQKVESVTIKNSEGEKELKVDAVFIYIGQDPNTEFLPKEILDQNGFIITDESMKTSIEGIFAGGDVIAKKYRQISTAVADGTIAALEIKKYIDEK